MSPVRLILIGGGEHARVVLDAARSCAGRFEVVGYVDPVEQPLLSALGPRWLGDDATVQRSLPAGVAFVLGIGCFTSWPQRARIAESYRTAGASFATIVHRTAIMSPDAHVADGTVVMAGAIVNPGARLGEHCVVNTGAIIEHDVIVGSFTHACPGASVGGATRIGEGVLIGLGARLRDHITIGAGATIGMGAVVVRDVARGATVVGVPARPLRKGGAS